MTRILKLFIAAIVFSVSASAQGSASLTIDKSKQSAQSITLPDNSDLVKDFIEDLIKNSGGKAKRSDGYLYGQGIKSAELEGTKKVNAYFDIGKTKNDGREISVVTLVVKDDNEKFASDTLNADLYRSAGKWLNSFQMKMEVYKRDREIASLTAQLKDVNKELSALRKRVRNNKDDNIAAIKDNEKKLDDLTRRLEELQKN